MWRVAYCRRTRNSELENRCLRPDEVKSDVTMTSIVIVIPARLAATRLPGKPMALIGDVPMVVQVMRRAMEADIAPVVVACDAEEIAEVVRAHGGIAVLTRPDHPSGSDRVWEAVQTLESRVESRESSNKVAGEDSPPYLPPAGGGDKEIGAANAKPIPPVYGGERGGKTPVTHHPPLVTSFDIIINLQGDLPTLDPSLIQALIAVISRPGVDIATLAAPITRAEEHTSPSVVKAVIASDGRALYFTRATAPYGDGPRYHHIGLYAYRRAALARFVSLPPSPLEKSEKLEQLRALEDGLHIAVSVVDTVPLGVDTPEDLARARRIMERKSQ
jgi:3-deoxy-manno-octulosonate cytidylyltransferase (CMP-KDO synthetase)